MTLIISAILVYSVSVVLAQGKCDCSGLSMIGSGKKCIITNRSWTESLCNDYNDNGRLQIFTWIPDGSGTQCDWNIETDFTNSGLKFKLKSLFSGDYFHTSDNYLSHNKGHWDIQPVPGSSGYVTIKSTEYNEYLYAAENHLNYDAGQRGVFTSKPTPTDVPVAKDWACHWTIQCN